MISSMKTYIFNFKTSLHSHVKLVPITIIILLMYRDLVLLLVLIGQRKKGDLSIKALPIPNGST